MKEIWTTDETKMIDELRRNSDENTPLTLLGPSLPPSFITIRAIVQDEGALLLEFEKPDGLELVGELFVFYRRDDMQLMRGFKLGDIRQTSRYFRMALPEHIFEVQRRKYPRIYVAEGSGVTCAPKASRRILKAQVIDVSMEGAKIFGHLSGITQGTVLAPLTLTLCYDDRRSDDVVINIAEARVVREIRVKEKVEISFHFHSESVDDLLGKYIELRTLEQEIYL